MDVSIKSTDKQKREATIKARDDKQSAKDLREQKRKDRERRDSDIVTERRLRRRIKSEVRKDLRTEKRSYLKGEATGDEYVINTRIRYNGTNWRYKRSFVEKILNEALAQHSGFEYKVDFKTDYGEDAWCNSISIWYTLLEH